VSQLKRKPDGGRRLAISYLNIGQAEDYRTYFPEIWKSRPPSWLIGADPEGWAGNFPVAYWNPEWQDILLGPRGLVQQIAR
jgi:cysteinyl-tRNA synthetase